MDDINNNFFNKFISEEDKDFPIITNYTTISSDEVIDVLKNIYDPEIPYSIYDLGLIYEIKIEEEKITIIMTLTSASCPEAQTLPQTVKDQLLEKFNTFEIVVELSFEPLWTIDNMTDEVKLSLNLL